MTTNQINYMNTMIDRARLDETQRHNVEVENLEKKRFNFDKKKTLFSIFF